MSGGEFVLRARGLTKKVSSPEGELTILDEVTFDVARGSTAAIVGPSGAGKSTLLALLAGLDEPSSGQVWLNGAELTALDEDGRASMRNREVGFVFQSFHLLPALTAIENVMLPLELSGSPNAAARAREALTDVGLEQRLRHYPRQLSGGEKQRVAIARAFVAGPSLLFADEPTGQLGQQDGRAHPESPVRHELRERHDARARYARLGRRAALRSADRARERPARPGLSINPSSASRARCRGCSPSALGAPRRSAGRRRASARACRPAES